MCTCAIRARVWVYRECGCIVLVRVQYVCMRGRSYVCGTCRYSRGYTRMGVHVRTPARSGVCSDTIVAPISDSVTDTLEWVRARVRARVVGVHVGVR